jgi:hypothetical protein
VSQWLVALWRFVDWALRPTEGPRKILSFVGLGGLAGVTAIAGWLGSLIWAAVAFLGVLCGLLLVAGASVLREQMRADEAQEADRVCLRFVANEAVPYVYADHLLLSVEVMNDGPTSDFTAKVLPGVQGVPAHLMPNYGNFRVAWENESEPAVRIPHDRQHRIELGILYLSPFIVRFKGPRSSYSDEGQTMWAGFTPTGPLLLDLEVRDQHRDVPHVERLAITFDAATKEPGLRFSPVRTG